MSTINGMDGWTSSLPLAGHKASVSRHDGHVELVLGRP